MSESQDRYINVNQLCIGLYIHLDLGWMDHPFTFGNFKIKDEEQIATIKKLGLKQVRYSPARSDCAPLPSPPLEPVNTGGAAVEESTKVESLEATEEKARPSRLERLQQLQQAIDENEKQFIAASNISRQVLQEFKFHPHETIQKTENLVNGMVDSIMTEADITIHAINGSRSGDEHYVHSLNVMVLSLMLSKYIDVSDEDMRLLGKAAMFHDIGKVTIPTRITAKTGPLTSAEQSYLQEHSELGARAAKAAGMPERICSIILQHHENADGTGYPARLIGAQIDPLARLLALINAYDNMCNPINPAIAMTPYETLAHMFAHQRTKYDETLLSRLIKVLGVYPPGSIVQLSNGFYAIVISVNPSKPLRPMIMVHEPHKKRETPLLLDLREEPGISISTCLRPNQLPPDALNYLNPRKRISYFLDKTRHPEQPGLA